MKPAPILLGLALVAFALLVVAIGATVVVLIAAGLGALLSRFLSFSIFEASLLSLIATIGIVILGGQVIAVLARIPSLPPPTPDDQAEGEQDEEEWEDDEEWENDDEEDWEETPLERDFPATPRWQRPGPRVEFDKVGRNDPCPCGSGKKYKHCHGRAAASN